MRKERLNFKFISIFIVTLCFRMITTTKNVVVIDFLLLINKIEVSIVIGLSIYFLISGFIQIVHARIDSKETVLH